MNDKLLPTMDSVEVKETDVFTNEHFETALKKVSRKTSEPEKETKETSE